MRTLSANSSGTKKHLRTDAVGLWCLACYALLAHLARQPGEPDLLAFLGLAAAAGLPPIGLFVVLRRRGEAMPVGRLFLWAVAFRACGLVGGPLFEDDFYRYLWDGYRFAVAGTPYGAAPEAFFGDPAVPAALGNVLDGINYPELPTIYAPVTQVSFLLAYWMKPASVLPLQILLVVVDLVTIAVLLRLCAPRNVLLYAWCPLVVKEIAFTAHPDGIGVCLALAAIVLAQSRRFPAAALLLGLASGARVFALLLVPFVLDPKAGARFRHHFLFAGVLAGVYLPFLLQGPADLFSLGIFARDWEFNTAVFGLLRPAVGDSAARLLAASLFALFWAFLWLRFRRDTSGSRHIPGDWLYGGLLLLSPVINSWYLLWVLPFAAMAPSVWAWTASLAVLLSYVTGLNLEDFSMQPFEQPLWGRGLEFGLILIALLVDLALRRRRSHLEATS